MCLSQSGQHFVLQLGWEDRLEPQLGDTLLAARRTDRRARVLAAEEGACALRVPAAPRVLADAPGARGEERLTDGIERFARHEDDELAIHPASMSSIRDSVA